MPKSVIQFSRSWYYGQVGGIVLVCPLKWWVWLVIRGGRIGIRIRKIRVWEIEWIRKRRVRVVGGVIKAIEKGWADHLHFEFYTPCLSSPS